MKWPLEHDDKEDTTILISKGVRRKLGDNTTGNEKLAQGLERILDDLLEKKGYTDIPKTVKP